MAGLRQAKKQAVVTNRLVDRLASDPTFHRLLAQIQSRYPDHFPLTRERLAAGIPIHLGVALADLARSEGLDRLPAPWWLASRAALADRSSTCSVRPTASTETWQRYADWFFDHFRNNRSLAAISIETGYSLDTVQRGIRLIGKLFHAGPTPGKPGRHYYGSQELHIWRYLPPSN